LLFALSHFEQLTELLDDNLLLKQIINFSASCGALTVTKAGAFPALPNFEQAIVFGKEQGLKQMQLLDIFSRSR